MIKKAPFSIALGAAFAASLAVSSPASADNPFRLHFLKGGYDVADAADAGNSKDAGDQSADKKKDEGFGTEKTAGKRADGKCGEAKCGSGNWPNNKPR